MKKILKYAPIAAAMLLITSCAGKKSIAEGTQLPTQTTSKENRSDAKTALKFMQRVADNKVYAANILANAEFTLQTGGHEISCPAKLSMRKDECIRLQLLMPILRTELARIEFTPSHVLILDRYHKEYIQAAYSEVSFLANNGLSFYSLQALFWNQLTVPGAKSVAESDLKKFSPDLNAGGTSVPVTLKADRMTYTWSVDRNSALINNAEISYSSAAHGTSTLSWNYALFQSLGSKMFPMKQQFGFSTNYGGSQRAATVTLQLSAPKTSSDWNTQTDISSKYKKVEVEDLLRKITSLQ